MPNTLNNVFIAVLLENKLCFGKFEQDHLRRCWLFRFFSFLSSVELKIPERADCFLNWVKTMIVFNHEKKMLQSEIRNFSPREEGRSKQNQVVTRSFSNLFFEARERCQKMLETSLNNINSGRYIWFPFLAKCIGQSKPFWYISRLWCCWKYSVSSL